MRAVYRFLRKEDFTAIHKTFLEAYSDYVVKFQLTEVQLENHIAQNAVEFEKSVGAFADGEMIGVTLNGFGVWNGKKTIYDAGTGVVPNYRRKGAGRAMFDFMMPKFKENGIDQILLEVISHNEKAAQLYRSLGFEETRRLVFFEQNGAIKAEKHAGFEIREIEKPDWNLLESFCDAHPSWQNSAASIKRTISRKNIVGAYLEKRLIGFGIVFSRSGTIAQLAVDRAFRGRGIALNILAEIRKRVDEKTKLRFSNVDENLHGLGRFMKKCGFKEFLSQIEMIRIL